VWSPARRPLTAGLVLTVTLVAFESLSVATILPLVSRQLGGVRLYGWVFSAFFLGNLVGIVVAGRQADEVGLRGPFLVGLVLFGAGLIVCGLAPDMEVLVAARAVQGFGAGAIVAAAYVGIGRGYPNALRPRMFAVLSTAWVVPGLAGPALSGFVADRVGWRWVFLGLLPLVAMAGVLTVPKVGHLGPPADDGSGDRSGDGSGDRSASAGEADLGSELGSEVGSDCNPGSNPNPGSGPGPAGSAGLLVNAIRLAAGAGLLLAGLTVASVLLSIALVAAGLAIGVPSFIRLVPTGTLRARPGLPAAVLTRGILTFAFFGADAFVPFTLTSIRGASATTAGIALTCSALTWTTGSWVQERQLLRLGPRRLIVAGFGCVLVAIVGFATLLLHSVPLVFGPVMWGISGFGMGLAYAPISVTVLHEAEPGTEGGASAGLQLTDVLGVALGTGICGAAVALGHTSGWDPRLGLLIAFGLTAAVAVCGMAAARRLPTRMA
jgi:MFS family permease